ncbi:MAG: hypothetical protein HQL84_13875 [Magnetococcales bacterium]|nr:hypothetical protein [Magnetococcales bacterium]MBF0151124.1 hypothetical protein [Magnetococcales bacterium]
MNAQDITKANDPLLRASPGAMQRAAQLARKVAMQTDTCLVILHEGQLVRISAEELRRGAPFSSGSWNETHDSRINP